MILRFDQPAMLYLALLALPLIVIGWRSLSAMDRLRRTSAIGLRTLVLMAIALVLANPRIEREHDNLTVIGLIDVSNSVRRFAEVPEHPEEGSLPAVEYVRRWFRQASKSKQPDDRFGLVAFDGQALAVSVPTKAEYVDDGLSIAALPGTNMAEAVELALAMFPADAARRMVLVSDGNETAGSVVDAARQAAGLAAAGTGVPIDIVPLEYRRIVDAQILSLETPANAQPGQTVIARIILQATKEMTGDLSLLREGRPVDINGAQPGTSRRVTLPAGRSVHEARVKLGRTPVNRFEAVFEPAADSGDLLPQNNRAEAFTATPTRGMVLLADRKATSGLCPLEPILTQAELPVRTVTPEDFPSDLLSLQNYDLVVLSNVAAPQLGPHRQLLLTRYVNDLGGGLIMIGGENSFGAGGWNNTAVEDILPVELDPAKELRLPSAALVLVLDKSGSMNHHVAGARATQQQIANEAAAMAIESLRSDSMVGVVTFDFNAHKYIKLQRNSDPAKLAERVRGIRAEGGTDLEPALLEALSMLRDVEAEKKRVVCLSDGQSRTTDLDGLVQDMNKAGIKLTTIAVGDDADVELLSHLAKVGDGTFYNVRNPRTLPRVLVESVQVVNKPLIKETLFVPVVEPTGSTLTIGMDQAPQLGGLVITARRDNPLATVEMTHPDGEPLLAHWQAGLGRVAVFTSDMGGPWSRRWDDWPIAAAFWTQLARTAARPAMNRDAELITQISGDRLLITLEAAGDEEGFLDYLQVGGTVYGPDGRAQAVRLQQAAPGRYTTSIDATAAGNYIVALNPRRGERNLSPVIGGVTQTSNPEFRHYQPNPTVLNRVAEFTSGRRLDLADPARANLFDRAGMPRSVSSMPAWRNVIWLAIALLLLDVACRRIAWSAAMLRRLLVSAATIVTPSQVRGGQAAATLSSLRQASERFDEHMESESRGVEKLDAPASPVRRFKRDLPMEERTAASPSKVGAALNAFLGRRSTPPPPPPPEAEESADETAADTAAQPPEVAPRPDEDGDETPGSETTSSLLAAKRRARKQLGGNSDQ